MQLSLWQVCHTLFLPITVMSLFASLGKRSCPAAWGVRKLQEEWDAPGVKVFEITRKRRKLSAQMSFPLAVSYLSALKLFLGKAVHCMALKNKSTH